MRRQPECVVEIFDLIPVLDTPNVQVVEHLLEARRSPADL